MWLVHKPSGNMALLAKNWGDDLWEPYTGPRNEPYYSVEELIATCGYGTEYYISYESIGLKMRKDNADASDHTKD
jgi:hypothetical protein